MLEKIVTSTPVTDLITEAASFNAAISSNVFPGIARVMRASLIMIFPPHTGKLRFGVADPPEVERRSAQSITIIKCRQCKLTSVRPCTGGERQKPAVGATGRMRQRSG